MARAQKKPADVNAFLEDAELMVNICNKFAHEPNAQKLHKAASAVQMNRTINCVDYYGECKAYTSFLGLAIRVSKDGEVSELERAQMNEALEQLRSAVARAKDKVK